MKSRFSTYKDGMLTVYKEKERDTGFGAPKNVKKTSDMEQIVKLAFDEMSKRDEDLDFAESQGRMLSIKVKTRLHKKVSKVHSVVVEKTLYSIIKVDISKEKQEMYMYLEEVRELS